MSKTSRPGVSSKTPKNIQKEIVYFQQIWGKFLKSGDPYYNPNLSLEGEDFSINLSCLQNDPLSPSMPNKA
jgi:hypothetical protein